MDRKRSSLLKYFVIIIVFQIITFCSLVLIGQFSDGMENIAQKQVIVQKLHLNDFCLSTESRPNRRLSTPDLIGAFQDFPGLYDHFPSSSVLQPTEIILKKKHVSLY